uniref:Ubiquitin carboxyl-terminal hydrolase 13 n=1 Tax=Cajanus cajan TaxID=3821 RepID=A0A151R268_CAJCA|nr:Ubiquitin carboxyl-terminal hydrolase 13 [Cajanus cajan]
MRVSAARRNGHGTRHDGQRHKLPYGRWYKFDDERVTKEDNKRALEEQYGGEEELPQTNPGFNNTPFKFTKYSNAYMLVYIRESDKDKIICNVDEKDIAAHLRVAQDKDLKEQIGKDIYFDLVDHDKVRSFRVQKQTTFNVFKVGQLREVSNKVHNAELKLFLEVELGMDSRPIAPPDKTKDDILLFFKLYDPEKEELRYVGRLFVKCTGKPSEYLTRLNEMAGYDPDEDIALYEGFVMSPTLINTLVSLAIFGHHPSISTLRETTLEMAFITMKRTDMNTNVNYNEIKFEPNVMCEPIDKKVTFRTSQLEDGDIICFQKASSMDSEENVRFPDVPSYLEYVHNRQPLGLV